MLLLQKQGTQSEAASIGPAKGWLLQVPPEQAAAHQWPSIIAPKIHANPRHDDLQQPDVTCIMSNYHNQDGIWSEGCPHSNTCLRVCRVPNVDIWPPVAFENPNGRIKVTVLSSYAPQKETAVFEQSYWWVVLAPVPQRLHQQYADRSSCFKDPIVFLSRDWINLCHFLHMQLLPLYTALAVFGLQHKPFHIAEIHYFPESRRSDHFAADLEMMSGNKLLPMDGDVRVQERVCSDTGVLGANPALHHLAWGNKTEDVFPGADFTFDKSAIRGFRAWLYHKYHIPMPKSLNPSAAAQQVVVTLVNRPLGFRRSILNAEVLEAAFHSRGVTLQSIDFGKLGLRQQLEFVANTSILVCPHGAALGWLAFLATGAVSVELMPYNFALGEDSVAMFAMGYRNLATLSDRSHVIWHNLVAKYSFEPKEEEDTRPKNHLTLLTPESADEIAAMALQQFRVPLSQRNYSRTAYVNKPATMP